MRTKGISSCFGMGRLFVLGACFVFFIWLWIYLGKCIYF